MKILNFGSCNIDYVYSLAHIARAGETLHASGFNIFPGGKGLNQSIALARSGSFVYHAGCVGVDGTLLTDMLKDNGVDISYIKKVREKNGHAVIQVAADGENSIFINSGSNTMITKTDVDNTLSHFEKDDIILLQNEISNLEYIVNRAYEKEMCIVLNPSPINETIFKLNFNMLSYIMINEVEAKAISGFDDIEESLEFFKTNYPALRVIITLGKNGCVYQGENEIIYHPIYEVTAVDTTAAGDTFTGYFVSSVSRGDSIANALKRASCASAITVSRSGAATSIPVAAEVDKLIDSMNVKKIDFDSNRLMRRVEKCITDNISSVTLSDISDELGYSTVYTGSLIKKITGFTFKEYLHKKRVAFAAEQLRDTNAPISEIIQKCGYRNEGYFRKLFKEKYKVNPLEYRKRR